MKESRRTFIRQTSLLAATPLSFMNFNTQSSPNQERPAPISSELVLDFVRNAHNNLARVKELLEKEPSLLNATWDWGKGDYESALGAAGHMGLVDMAEFLISKGARMDIFVSAMLGRLDIVKPMIEAYPSVKTSRGPHGITLLLHAEKGGENAKPVLEYLKSVGAS